MAAVKTETTYSLEHEDVAEIICDYFYHTHGITVSPEELHFNLREYRVNEGYYSGEDQKARINSIWFKK